jgi:peptidoglycan/LPS O-acetylase OafA/YrhL
MIQRIQSIYLLVATIAMALVSFKVPVWSLNNELTFAQDDTKMFILTITASLFSALAIFIFKNRKLQMKLIRLAVLVIAVIAVRLGLLLGNSEFDFELNFNCTGLLLFAFAALAMAYRGVKKDDDLIRSVDRIR